MINKKIVVFGYSDVGHACLEFLLERGENVVGVYTHEDNPAEKIWFPSTKKLAQDHHVWVKTNPDFSNPAELTAFKNLAPDLLFSFYFRNLLPLAVLKLPPLGAYNMHGSLLPKFRGRAPVNWAIIKGEKETGATLHEMVERADAGDIIDQEAVSIGEDDTTLMVQSRVTDAAVKILNRQIENLKAGKVHRKHQNISLSTYYGRRSPEDGRIDWNRSSVEIHNLIRAVSHPYPGAFTDIFGEKTYIWSSSLPKTKVSGFSPGHHFSKENRLFVVCGDGQILELKRVQVEKFEEIDGHEFSKTRGLT